MWHTCKLLSGVVHHVERLFHHLAALGSRVRIGASERGG